VLDLKRMERIRLSARPRFQRVVAQGLRINYGLPPRVHIRFEGFERLPDHPVIFAMNHTDRYNYWPFQYRLYRKADRFTATWVKGKYYRNRLMAWFMEKTNNIPTVSRGYLISEDFLATAGRPPSRDEYSALRVWVDGGAPPELSIPDAVIRQARNTLGRPFRPEIESYDAYIRALFVEMMRLFVDLNSQCFDKGLDLLVFPQGTRSVRLSRGHGGLSQIAMKYGRTIVPVGCNGCDRVYPGSSPFARGGNIVYRFGHPIRPEDMAAFQPDRDYAPFTPDAEAAHSAAFQGLVDVVMERINGLLDRRHQFTEDRASDGVEDASRFL